MTKGLGERILPRSGAAWTTLQEDGFRLHLHSEGEDETLFARSVAASLNDTPRWLHCRWLYDPVGSEIYERITEQPEYYLTRTEDRILADNAAALRDLVGDATVVELGSGSSLKTRHILEAWSARGAASYVPIDISYSALEAACAELAAAFPGLRIDGLAARYSLALPLIGDVSPLLLLFLGSTMGNFDDGEVDLFLRMVSDSLRPGDHFLLGLDLIKDAAVLNAAYNDAAGWTRKFMINVLARMNREFGSEIPLDVVEYDGFYSEQLQRVEMYLRFTEAVSIELPDVAAPIRIAAGESVFVESSRKFDVGAMVRKTEEFGFTMRHCFTDPDELFGVLLLTRA